jgi:ubiquinone/menaquinone biosynthesis C-methylase UbiE
MNNQLQSISNEQKGNWNKVANSWKKWDAFTMNFMRPTGDVLVKALDIKEDDVALDIASGTGEPAFTIAGLTKKGKVQATDLSEEMLNVAAGYARERGIHNVDFKVADVSHLPFGDNTFDKISCRMGFMFFPDMQMAAREIYRVCRSGGKMAVSVWASAEENDWHTTITKVLSKHVEVPRPAPGAPGMFRCAAPGFMKQLFEQAGFQHVSEQPVSGTIDFGTAENYWQNRTEMSEPVVKILSEASEETYNNLKADLITACNNRLTNGRLLMNYGSVVISGVK